MAERTRTPDILANVMSGIAPKEEKNEIFSENQSRGEGSRSTNEQTSKYTKSPLKKDVDVRANKPRVQQKSVPVQLLIDGSVEESQETNEEFKERANFNLPVSLMIELEDKCYEIRKISGSKQITKSLLIEESLKMAFAEFDLKKHTGKFYAQLINNKSVKK